MEAWVLSEQHHRVAARCVDETVIYDYASGKKSMLKPFMVDKFRQTFELQMQRKAKGMEKINTTVEAVEDLERVYQ